MASSLSVAPFIKEYYPQYWGIETYPIDRCARITRTTTEWGILGNMYKLPLVVDSFTFDSSEQLFQMMKFKDPKTVLDLLNGNTLKGKKCYNVKKTAKNFEANGLRRPDWGSMIVDAMKFCLQQKYEQSPEFRQELERSRGLFIVEDQTSFPKKQADTWGVKPAADGIHFEGPNLLGRLLMELRDNGHLDYTLPADALTFINTLKQ